MKKLYIGLNIDWSKSFVDPNGAFYCGTTEEQKGLAAGLMPYMDLTINTTDFHSVKSKEFKANGGMWPFHNVAEYQRIDVMSLGLPEGTTISPEQTLVIDERINKTRAGIMVPRHVYFQDGETISFTPKLVEEAFGYPLLTPEEFMEQEYTYLIAPKMHFDATTIISQRRFPSTKIERVSQDEYTVFDLIDAKYGQQREIVYIGTGVVDNICRHYTTTGLRQKYGARVVNLVGATTELFGVGLGFNERHQVRLACERIQRDIGIEHKTLDEIIEEIGGTR